MAFEAITSAVLNALGGNKDALGPVSGKAADDPGWLTSTGKDVWGGRFVPGEDIYWPQTDNFYFKKGQWYLKPNEDIIPKSLYTGSEGELMAVSDEVKDSAIAKAWYTETPEVRQAIGGQDVKFTYGEGLSPDPKDPYSYWDDPKAREGLSGVLLPEGVDPYRSFTQRALDIGLGLINPPRFGQQASTAINPNVIPSNVDPLFLPPIREPMTGREAIEEYGPLTSSTARADGSIPQPGDTDWRGYTAEDVPLKDIRGGALDFLNPFRYLENIANIPGIETIGRNLAGAGAAAVSAPVLAGIAGVGSALYPTRMGDAYIGEPVTSNVPLRDGTVRAGDTTFADQVAAERYGVQRYTADPAKEAAFTKAFLNPKEFGLDPFTNEQIREARATYLRLMGKPSPTYGPDPDLASLPSHILREDVVEGLADAPGEDIYQVLQKHFDEAEAKRISLKDVPGAYEVASAGDYIPMIDNTTVAPSPFIGDEGFTPSLGGYTIAPSGPVVGDEEEEVSEERVVEIKKKPKEKRTSVEEQVVVASAVKKALSNASKGKKVKNELKAIVELAKVDPTIVKRYTTVGSQELQDITSGVDSFAWMPPPKKKKAKPGYGKPPTRPGGR